MSTPPESPEMKQKAREMLADDVVRLVIAAREVAFGGQFDAIKRGDDGHCLRELDAASEAFASRVPWDEEPASEALSTRSTPSIDGVEGLIERGWKFGGNNSANDEDRPGAWMTSPKGGTVSQYMLRRAISELGQVGPLKHTAWLMDQFSSLIGALASLPTIGRGVSDLEKAAELVQDRITTLENLEGINAAVRLREARMIFQRIAALSQSSGEGGGG